MKESTIKSIIAAVTASVTTFIITSCGTPDLPAQGFSEDSYSMIEIESDFVYRIYEHEPTGVYYIIVKDGSGAKSVCVMVNADGTPYTGE